MSPTLACGTTPSHTLKKSTEATWFLNMQNQKGPKGVMPVYVNPWSFITHPWLAHEGLCSVRGIAKLRRWDGTLSSKAFPCLEGLSSLFCTSALYTIPCLLDPGKSLSGGFIFSWRAGLSYPPANQQGWQLEGFGLCVAGQGDWYGRARREQW